MQPRAHVFEDRIAAESRICSLTAKADAAGLSPRGEAPPLEHLAELHRMPLNIDEIADAVRREIERQEVCLHAR